MPGHAGKEDHTQPRWTSRRGQDSPWKSQSEWQRTKINGEINQSIKFISKCKNSAHSKHVMHLGGTARRIALTAAQCYSFIYK